MLLLRHGLQHLYQLSKFNLTFNLPAPDRAWGFHLLTFRKIIYKIKRMRKVINILSIVTLLSAAVSCVKSDRIYDNSRSEIDIDPVMSVMSKAIVSGTGYPVDVPFGVFATYSSNPAGEWTSGPVQSYLENKKFIHKGDNKYGGEQPAYWPLSGSLVFAGYSPYYPDSGSVSATFDAETKTLSISNFVSDGQTDLMYFLPDLSNGNLVGRNSRASSVPAVFSHALSLVEFNVKGVDNDETVELKNITFKNIPLKGNLTADASACSWDALSSHGDLPVFSSVDGEVLSSETPVTATSLVIPGSAVNIDLAYDAVGATSHDKTGTITPENAVTEWVAGKKYIYNLTIRSGFIVIESVTTSYIAENESGIGI